MKFVSLVFLMLLSCAPLHEMNGGLHAIEYFAGQKAITRSFTDANYIAASFERDDDPRFQDLLSEPGEVSRKSGPPGSRAPRKNPIELGG